MADPTPPASDIPEQMAFHLVWTVAESVFVLLANQFLIQEGQDTFYLSVGQVIPPALLGTPEERYEQAKAISFVPVTTLARFSMNRRNVEELVGILRTSLDNYDKQQKEQAR